MNLNLNQFLRFPQSRIGRYLAQVTLVAIAFAVGARLAFAIQGVNPFASSVWPPAGIAQAGLLLFGPKAWPAIVLGIFFLNLVNPSEQIFVLWFAGNVGAILQAVFAATVLRWLGFRPSLERLKDVVNLIFFGGMFCTQISCTIGAFSLYLAGKVGESDYWSLRWNWWLGDAMGVLIFTFFILIFSIIADTFAEVTVLFADIVGFTQISSQISPPELVSLLNDIFSTFDRVAQKHALEKIKTIGDAYMVVGGLPVPRRDHAEAIAQMAIDMQQAIIDFSNTNNQDFSIRIGINSGPVVAGVIGIKKFIYNLWRDTVNTASRMESHGLPGRIQVTTSATYERLQDKLFIGKSWHNRSQR